jgi:hypothetical protein
MQVRPMILGEAVPTERLAASAFEVQARSCPCAPIGVATY